MEIKVGDKHFVNIMIIPGADLHEVIIVALSTKEVSFLLSGVGVVNPEAPRIMPIIAFVKWLRMTKVEATQ